MLKNSNTLWLFKSSFCTNENPIYKCSRCSEKGQCYYPRFTYQYEMEWPGNKKPEVQCTNVDRGKELSLPLIVRTVFQLRSADVGVRRRLICYWATRPQRWPTNTTTASRTPQLKGRCTPRSMFYYSETCRNGPCWRLVVLSPGRLKTITDSFARWCFAMELELLNLEWGFVCGCIFNGDYVTLRWKLFQTRIRFYCKHRRRKANRQVVLLKCVLCMITFVEAPSALDEKREPQRILSPLTCMEGFFRISKIQKRK